MTRTLSRLSFATLCALSLSACAGECTLQVRDGWIRLPPGMGAGMAAGFGRIENSCPAPATIVAASSPAFADTSLHETKVVGGISRMRALPQLHIAANASTVLAPGGLHLMLMQPTAAVKPGATVAVRFTLQDGRTISGDFQVRTIGQ